MERYIMPLAVNTAFSRDFPILVKGEELFATQALKTFELMELMDAKWQECTIASLWAQTIEIPRWGGRKDVPEQGFHSHSKAAISAFYRMGAVEVCILDAVITRRTLLAQIFPVQKLGGARL